MIHTPPLSVDRAPGVDWRTPRLPSFGAWPGWRRLGLALLVGLAAYNLAVLAALWWQGERDERRPADAILVLGAAQWNGQPSPILRARLDHARDLYLAGLAPRVVVMGGIGEGDKYSEADVAARYLRDQQVPPPAILLEDQGRSSLASIRAAGEVLAAHGWSRVLLVSDPPHMLRILRMARAAGLEAYGSPTPYSPLLGSPGPWMQFMLRELLLYQAFQWGLHRG